MRIIAGEFRGRTLQSPATEKIRPTSDKVRGAIFNILAHGDWPRALFDDSTRVLDGFCGSGALGLEALSRGAGAVLFLDQSNEALQLAKSNAELLKTEKLCRFENRDLAAAQKNKDKPYHLVFLDPPYRKNLGIPALKQLDTGGFIATKPVVIIETGKLEELEAPTGWIVQTSRSWGETAAHFLIRE